MKRFCPHCGYDQFGKIPAVGGVMRCIECGEDFHSAALQTFSRKPNWWYCLVAPLLLTPALIALVAPLLNTLAPGYALDSKLTFWGLAASPVFLYILLCWVFASHRLARWYFGAIVASLVLVVANALLIGILVVLRV